MCFYFLGKKISMPAFHRSCANQRSPILVNHFLKLFPFNNCHVWCYWVCIEFPSENSYTGGLLGLWCGGVEMLESLKGGAYWKGLMLEPPRGLILGSQGECTIPRTDGYKVSSALVCDLLLLTLHFASSSCMCYHHALPAMLWCSQKMLARTEQVQVPCSWTSKIWTT